jgi:hypothetical protein
MGSCYRIIGDDNWAIHARLATYNAY